MNSIIIAFGIAGVMLTIGTLLRAKVKFLQSILMPASVIGGIVGLVVVNLLVNRVSFVKIDDFSSIVDLFFIFALISVGLADKSGQGKLSRAERKLLSKQEKKDRRHNSIATGAISLGLVWCAVYGVQAFVGGALCEVFGKSFGLNSLHGMMIAFGFSQGPGQAYTYGQLFEGTYGLPNAEMVAITFAVIGFLAAFLIGVPLARYGLKRSISKRSGEISDIEKRGYYRSDEEGSALGKTTTYGGNIETLTMHLAIMGIAYLMTLVFCWAVSFIPGIGESFAAMKFFWGMIAGIIIRAVLKALKLEYILDNTLINRITAFFTDYVVVTAFMAIELAALGMLIIPIAIISVVTTVVTLLLCVYFCSRMGSDHDFEKLLALFGTSTGTVSSGISLMRIADPMLVTTTAQELGYMNVVNLMSAPVITLAALAATGTISMPVAMIGFLLSALLDVVLLIIAGGYCKKPTFKLMGKKEVCES